MTDRLDFPLRYREQLEALLCEHVPHAEVWAYGSRVNGESHEGSDLDLVVRGPSLEPLGVEFIDLVEALQESNIPILVQAHDWAGLPESFHREIERDYVVVQQSLNTKPTARWRRVDLGDVTDLQLSSVDKKSKANEQSVRLCNYTDVYNNSFIHAGMDFMSATATQREIERCLLRPGDVIITKDSEKHDDIGVPALMRDDVSNLICGYHLAILRPRESEVDGAYLYYALSADEVQQQFHSYANGITRFGLRKADIGLVQIPIPPLSEQRAIAHVLGTLDDKIELNRQMNETLEAMARALFKSWFVDFEPVRAKMEGRWRKGESLPGLPAEHYDLFPDRLVDSELGQIPDGWEVKQLGEVVEAVGGTTPSTKVTEYWEEGTHCWATPKDLSALASPVLLDTERHITDAGLEKIPSGLLPPGTLLLSSRAPIGYLAISEQPLAINQGFIAIPPSDTVPTQFMLHWCRVFHDAIVNHANGSTFLEISKGNFRIIPFVLPTEQTLEAFDSCVRPLYQRLTSHERESRSLAAQRDALLPGLVSGEVGVSHPVSHAYRGGPA